MRPSATQLDTLPQRVYPGCFIYDRTLSLGEVAREWRLLDDLAALLGGEAWWMFGEARLLRSLGHVAEFGRN